MSSQDKLPPPWELRWSTTKSRFYFYNSKTKSSQWQSPLKGHTVSELFNSLFSLSLKGTASHVIPERQPYNIHVYSIRELEAAWRSHSQYQFLSSTFNVLLKTDFETFNNNNNFRVSNIRVSNRTLIYNVCPEAALT